MRSRGAALAALALAAAVALPASAAVTSGEPIPLPDATSWSSSRSNLAIGDHGTLAWVSSGRVDGQDDVVVRTRAPGATTWSAA